MPAGKGEMPLREALLKQYEITLLTGRCCKKPPSFPATAWPTWSSIARKKSCSPTCPGGTCSTWRAIFRFPGARPGLRARRLRRIPPRLYSISSSHLANPDEVDLTVAVVRYQAHDRDRFGTCSAHCAPAACRAAIGCRST